MNEVEAPWLFRQGRIDIEKGEKLMHQVGYSPHLDMVIHQFRDLSSGVHVSIDGNRFKLPEAKQRAVGMVFRAKFYFAIQRLQEETQ